MMVIDGVATLTREEILQEGCMNASNQLHAAAHWLESIGRKLQQIYELPEEQQQGAYGEFIENIWNHITQLRRWADEAKERGMLDDSTDDSGE